ncbi:MAG: 7-cyano-7-deazaguanine synthase QueC [Firmicutes bacterium]|nr:7-cyano-7-deazaguanine synthase QueC [Bacillota bacterium]
MKSIALLSGGLDSTVSLAQALRETEVSLCLTFDYGQRAAKNEIDAAGALASHYGLAHRVIRLPFLEELTKTALVAGEDNVPEPAEDDLDNIEASSASAASVWVPNRNGLFINIAASFAESLNCQIVVTGFNREEAATFPDNSEGFVDAVNRSLSYSTLNKVIVISYTQRLDKVDIIKLGRRLGVPFQHVWSCYRGDDRMCGRCESCKRFYRAAAEAGLAKS